MKAQRILIADDDAKLLSLLTSSLKKAGYDTVEMPDGEAAWNFARQHTPDLILADVTMPKMDGFELCKRIRDDPRTTQIPFIFLTAKGELSDRVTGLNLGADDYISKPFHITEVVARIKAILQRTTGSNAEPEEERESALKGNLEQMPLAELVHVLNSNKKTGGLKLVHQAHVGKIYFNAGNIVQASLGKYKNEEALYRILVWEEGYFEFDARDTIEKPTMTASTMGLLMDGFNQKEEYVKYRDAMPPFDHIVKIPEGVATSDLKSGSQKIVELVDGKRTIQDIVNVSPLNYLVTVKLIYTLVKKGTLQAVEPEQSGEQEDQDYGQLAHDLYE